VKTMHCITALVSAVAAASIARTRVKSAPLAGLWLAAELNQKLWRWLLPAVPVE
jgi:ABC-type enterobactin transport system permease subunit